MQKTGGQQFLRYAGVGMGATAAHYAVLVAGVEWLGVAPTWAAATGAVTGAALSYGFNRRLTFDSRAAHRQALPRFAIVAAASAAFSAATVAAGTAIGWPYLAAQMVATALVLLGGFPAHRRWTFP